MKRSLLRSFAWISLILLLAVSCRSVRMSGPAGQAVLLKEFISTAALGKITFRTKIILGERELSGSMLVKKMPGGGFRVAFYNELGMSYIEGKLEREGKSERFSVNNIAPVLDHSVFLRRFEECLQVLLVEDIDHQYVISETNPEETQIIIHSGREFRMEVSPQI